MNRSKLNSKAALNEKSTKMTIGQLVCSTQELCLVPYLSPYVQYIRNRNRTVKVAVIGGEYTVQISVTLPDIPTADIVVLYSLS
jgi:hypothetical protein